MNSKVRCLYLCKVSALLAGAALPNSAIAHPVVTRSLDLHAVAKLTQYIIRKNRPYLQTGLYEIRAQIAVSKSAQLQTVSALKNANAMLIASSSAQFQKELQAILQQTAARKASSKNSIGILNSRAKILRSQLQFARRAELLSHAKELQD
jgi:hypothetical protein